MGRQFDSIYLPLPFENNREFRALHYLKESAWQREILITERSRATNSSAQDDMAQALYELFTNYDAQKGHLRHFVLSNTLWS